jgi:hypothetical protein
MDSSPAYIGGAPRVAQWGSCPTYRRRTLDYYPSVSLHFAEQRAATFDGSHAGICKHLREKTMEGRNRPIAQVPQVESAPKSPIQLTLHAPALQISLHAFRIASSPPLRLRPAGHPTLVHGPPQLLSAAPARACCCQRPSAPLTAVHSREAAALLPVGSGPALVCRSPQPGGHECAPPKFLTELRHRRHIYDLYGNFVVNRGQRPNSSINVRCNYYIDATWHEILNVFHHLYNQDNVRLEFFNRYVEFVPP